MAPELYSNKHPNISSDIYSIEIIMYELASQCPLYNGDTNSLAIMTWKLDGRPPCLILKDCPQGLERD